MSLCCVRQDEEQADIVFSEKAQTHKSKVAPDPPPSLFLPLSP